jgi:hypothetical protein
VARYIEAAENLLDQAIGVRKRMDAASTPLRAFHVESGWAKDVRRWFSNARRGIGPYPQEQ